MSLTFLRQALHPHSHACIHLYSTTILQVYSSSGRRGIVQPVLLFGDAIDEPLDHPIVDVLFFDFVPILFQRLDGYPLTVLDDGPRTLGGVGAGAAGAECPATAAGAATRIPAVTRVRPTNLGSSVRTDGRTRGSNLKIDAQTIGDPSSP